MSINSLQSNLHDLSSNGTFKITNLILYTFSYKVSMKNYIASLSTWSMCCYGCEVVTMRHMAQDLCVVMGYNFKF
jgi:hypothetical protein